MKSSKFVFLASYYYYHQIKVHNIKVNIRCCRISCKNVNKNGKIFKRFSCKCDASKHQASDDDQ